MSSTGPPKKFYGTIQSKISCTEMKENIFHTKFRENLTHGSESVRDVINRCKEQEMTDCHTDKLDMRSRY